MKQWVHKLLEQFDFDWGLGGKDKNAAMPDVTEERATILYIIDTYSKHLIELDSHPVRKTREELDEFIKQMLVPHETNIEKLLFRFRQWFSSYRIDEYSYIQKAFEDFKGIIWDFVDQLAEDFEHEQIRDKEMKSSLEDLKEAVESNSIDALRTKSREFVDNYIEFQSRKEQRRAKRIGDMKKNLDIVKQKLVDANQTMRRDHLTNAYNRMSFDEQMKHQVQYYKHTKSNCCLIALDIDHFKKVNDTYGHDIGDFVLKECVKVLQSMFSRDSDFVARIGGEEFAIILPDYKVEHAVKKVEALLDKVRKDTYIIGDKQIRFTLSAGIAQIMDNETPAQWLKRADMALYHSKQTGRDRYTIALTTNLVDVA